MPTTPIRLDAINKIEDNKTRAIISKIVGILEDRKHIRRNPSRYQPCDNEVMLELDVVQLKIINYFTDTVIKDN